MPEVVLGEALEVLIDHRGKTPKKLGGDFSATGIPVASALLVKNGRLTLSEARHIPQDLYERWMPVRTRKNDVILTSEAPLGQCALVESDEPLALGQRVFGLRGRAEILSSRYLYYALQTPTVQSRLHGRSSGTTVQGIRQSELVKVRIPAPAFKQQQAIAEVLGALDEKVAVNERITKTAADLCRAMMQGLWKQGRVASLVIDSATDAQDWSRTTLGELCAEGGGSIQTGPFGSQLHASDYVESGIPSVMPQNIGDNVILEDSIARVSDADIRRLSKYQLAEGDIVYSRRGDVKRRALVRSHESGWLCGTGCLRVRPRKAVEPLFLSHYLGEPEVQDWIHQHAVGATMPNLNTAILGAVPVVVPPAEIRAHINQELAILDARSMAAIRESRTLAALRDTLLPQLVAGKLRIKDAERTMEAAA
ncbi:restriction endonuclease subunit S [Streptomyces sp. 7N604]|uniref:restriction endonuclease subunit S n=1 Tax=Streptomyces sp. 7N604 TaxID=3457415 RepID=UPI003FD18200